MHNYLGAYFSFSLFLVAYSANEADLPNGTILNH